MVGLIKRLIWGLVIGFAVYVFMLLFFVQGNSLIFSESNFTVIGLMATLFVAMSETAASTIGMKETKKVISNAV